MSHEAGTRYSAWFRGRDLLLESLLHVVRFRGFVMAVQGKIRGEWSGDRMACIWRVMVCSGKFPVSLRNGRPGMVRRSALLAPRGACVSPLKEVLCYLPEKCSVSFSWCTEGLSGPRADITRVSQVLVP